MPSGDFSSFTGLTVHINRMYHCVGPQGAPESVLERCNYIRVSGSASVPLTPFVREQLLSTLRDWGSGRDTLRCLAMATRDAPPDLRCLNLEDTAAFISHEVGTDELCPAVPTVTDRKWVNWSNFFVSPVGSDLCGLCGNVGPPEKRSSQCRPNVSTSWHKSHHDHR